MDTCLSIWFDRLLHSGCQPRSLWTFGRDYCASYTGWNFWTYSHRARLRDRQWRKFLNYRNSRQSVTCSRWKRDVHSHSKQKWRIHWCCSFEPSGGFAGGRSLASYSNVNSSSATLTLTASATATIGTFTVTVTGTNGGCQQRSTTFSLQVIALPQQAAYYIGTNQHIYEAVLANNIWGSSDVTALTNTLPATTGSGLTSFKNGSIHSVYYVDINGDVNQLTWTTGVWVHTD